MPITREKTWEKKKKNKENVLGDSVPYNRNHIENNDVSRLKHYHHVAEKRTVGSTKPRLALNATREDPKNEKAPSGIR